MRNPITGDQPRGRGAERAPVRRAFALPVGAAWLAAAALLYWLAPALGATYLVASGWLAAGGLLVWALVRWPAFQRTRIPRRRDGEPPGGAPDR